MTKHKLAITALLPTLCDGLLTGGENRLAAAGLQSFVRKSGPALREVFTPSQVSSLQAVADDLHRSSLSVSGTKTLGGSDTVQNAGALTFGRALVGEGKTMALAGSGIMTSAAAGSYMGGPLGAALGAVVGAAPAVGRAMVVARGAGINTVNDLVREAMLNPELARVLLAKVTPANKASLAQSLVQSLGRASLLPPMDSHGKRMPPAGQPSAASKSNTLADLASNPLAGGRANLLASMGQNPLAVASAQPRNLLASAAG